MVGKKIICPPYGAYVEWMAEAKTEVTRDKRLAQALEWMAAGKVRNWKYLRK